MAPADHAVDQDDALVALAHLREIALHDMRLAEGGGEDFEQRGEILVALGDAEDAGAAVAVERLDDDVAVLLAERADLVRVARDQRRRHQLGELGDEEFFRRVPHMRRVVHHQRLGMDALEEMRRGDVGHVEGRVLAQQHHVEAGQVGELRRARA